MPRIHSVLALPAAALLVPALLTGGAGGGDAAAAPASERVVLRAAEPADDPCPGHLDAVESAPHDHACTHGDDPLPPGATGRPVAPLSPAESVARSVECVGDGRSGPRVQVLYVRSSDRPDRFAAYHASFQAWVAEMDQIFVASAPDSPVPAHVRFVHDGACQPVIDAVTLSPAADDDFDAMVGELSDRGYSRTDRKYVVFADADVYCGLGTISDDDRPGPTNFNNQGPDYSRIDTFCWGAHTLAHELMHNLGGVQLSSPNASGGFHCTDERDVMCYSDAPYYPTMRYLCPDSDENRFDCGDDDYYDATPAPGSYLDTHWNAINSRFLTTGTDVVCRDRSTEPDDTPATAVALAVGEVAARAFCEAGDEDWFRIATTRGYRYDIGTLALGEGTDTVLEVYDAAGALLASDDDSGDGAASLVSLSAPGSALLVRVTAFGGASGGTYSVRADETPTVPCPDRATEPDDSAAAARQLTIGQPASRAFCDPGDEDWFRIDTRPGASYEIRTEDLGSEADTVLQVRDADGTVLATDDDSGDGVASLAVVVAPGPTLIARVRSYDPDHTGGTYSAAVDEVASPDALENGSFEVDADRDGHPDSWVGSPAFHRAQDYVTDGQWSGVLAPRRERTVGVRQRVDGVAPGGEYWFAGALSVPPTRDRFRAALRLRWLDRDGAALGSVRLLAVGRGTVGTRSSARLVTAPAGSAAVVVVVRATSLRGRVYVDGVELGAG